MMKKNKKGENNPNYRHGYSDSKKHHKLYDIWCTMKQRCFNPNNQFYKNYGGRGIGVCDEWTENPKSFIEWALFHGWEKGVEIDRGNNDGNYSPDNCRFVMRGVNINNGRLLRKSNTSGYRGVSFNKREKKWESYIYTDGKLNHLGKFDSPRLAALRFDVEVFLLNNGRPMNFADKE